MEIRHVEAVPDDLEVVEAVRQLPIVLDARRNPAGQELRIRVVGEIDDVHRRLDARERLRRADADAAAVVLEEPDGVQALERRIHPFAAPRRDFDWGRRYADIVHADAMEFAGHHEDRVARQRVVLRGHVVRRDREDGTDGCEALVVAEVPGDLRVRLRERRPDGDALGRTVRQELDAVGGCAAEGAPDVRDAGDLLGMGHVACAGCVAEPPGAGRVGDVPDGERALFSSGDVRERSSGMELRVAVRGGFMELTQNLEFGKRACVEQDRIHRPAHGVEDAHGDEAVLDVGLDVRAAALPVGAERGTVDDLEAARHVDVDLSVRMVVPRFEDQGTQRLPRECVESESVFVGVLRTRRRGYAPRQEQDNDSEDGRKTHRSKERTAGFRTFAATCAAHRSVLTRPDAPRTLPAPVRRRSASSRA